MHDLVPLVLRGLQLLFAIILLGMTGYLVSNTTGRYYGYHFSSPSQVAFMLFNAVWTLFPALPYLALGPRFLPSSFNNKVIHLTLDALTAIFWFAGFIALAAWYGDHDYCLGRACGVIVATCVFGAFEWLLFTATTVLNGIDFNRSRNSTSAVKTAPETSTV
ncbi:MAG: hypothetical protein Q9177_000011 [Variospora cf. flavescens]